MVNCRKCNSSCVLWKHLLKKLPMKTNTKNTNVVAQHEFTMISWQQPKCPQFFNIIFIPQTPRHPHPPTDKKKIKGPWKLCSQRCIRWIFALLLNIWLKKPQFKVGEKRYRDIYWYLPLQLWNCFLYNNYNW